MYWVGSRKASSSLDAMNGTPLLPIKRISLISIVFCLAQHFLQTYKCQRKKRKSWSHCRASAWRALEHYLCLLIKSFLTKIKINIALIYCLIKPVHFMKENNLALYLSSPGQLTTPLLRWVERVQRPLKVTAFVQKFSFWVYMWVMTSLLSPEQTVSK